MRIPTNGKNDRGKVYDRITLVFEDADHFEDFERLGREAREAKEREEKRKEAEKARLEKEQAKRDAEIAIWEAERKTGPPDLPALIGSLSSKFTMPKIEEKNL